MPRTIDLNADLGEWTDEDGALRDESLMSWLTSCNIACGGHTGDEGTMERTVSLALKLGVAIGAHPSYPDRAGFGRQPMDLSDADLRLALDKQLRDLSAVVRRLGGSLHHVKPHGALYHRADEDERTARILLDAMSGLDGIDGAAGIVQAANASTSPRPLLYGPPGGLLERMSEARGIPFCREVFADRVYEIRHDPSAPEPPDEPDAREHSAVSLRLRSRQLPGAVIEDADAMLRQLGDMILHGRVVTFCGRSVPILAQTLCLHSDTEGAPDLIRRIHAFLREAHVEIRTV